MGVSGERRHASPALLFSVLALLSAGLIVYSQTMAFAWDEGFHILTAQLIKHGKRPYIDFVFSQTPLNAYWNAAWMAVFGESWRVPHLMAALCSASAMILTGAFVLRRFPVPGWRLPGAMMAALWVGLNVAVVKYGAIAQPYGLCLLAAATAYWFSIRSVERHGALCAGLAGLACGVAAASSLLTAPLGPVLLLWLLVYNRAGRRWVKLAAFLLGGVIACIPVLGLLVQGPRQVWFGIVQFDSGVSIAIFFYDGATSRAIAFEGLLNSGENFAARLKAGFKDSAQPQLESVATDGESYGHHHRHGEMALAYAVRLLEQDKTVTLTNYASFLEQFPPEWECEVIEDTSWSCAHGVERWRSNCGCNGGKPGFSQLWRAPLRQALDELRDAITPMTDEEGSKFFTNIWAARDKYIDVILDRSDDAVQHFLQEHQSRKLTPAERVHALRLMEMQRHAQLMYTSCGWFFDDISGIETVQIIAYAARALQLATELFGEKAAHLETAFLARLSEAKSNVAAAGDGARIFKDKIVPMQLGLEQVAAHYAISSVFSSFAEETELFCYRVRRISNEVYTSGRGRLALGRAHITSTITGNAQEFSFAVLHFGDQNITAAVKPYSDSDEAEFQEFSAQASECVQRADFPDVIRLIDRYHGHVGYSLTSLFKDEQRRIVQLILNSTLWDIESSLTNIYEDHASLLHYLAQAGLPKPPALTLAAEFAINAGLRRALEGDPIDLALMRSYLQLARADKVPLETATLSYIADQRMKRAMVELQMSAGSLEMLERAFTLAHTLVELPFELNLWQAQNIWYEILRTSSYALTSQAADDRPRWDKDFNELGKCLSIETTAITAPDQLVEATGD